MSDEAPPIKIDHDPRAGSEPKIHHTPAETRERTYERARREGIAPEVARSIADETARRLHDTLDRRGR